MILRFGNLSTTYYAPTGTPVTGRLSSVLRRLISVVWAPASPSTEAQNSEIAKSNGPCAGVPAPVIRLFELYGPQIIFWLKWAVYLYDTKALTCPSANITGRGPYALRRCQLAAPKPSFVSVPLPAAGRSQREPPLRRLEQN